WDYSPEAPLGHYSAYRAIDVAALRREYEALKTVPPEEVVASSPLHATGTTPLPRYFVVDLETGSDLNAQNAAEPEDIVRTLTQDGWWPTPLRATSNPYRGDGPAESAPGGFRSTHVGDATDTSPYTTDTPVIGISTATYIAN